MANIDVGNEDTSSPVSQNDLREASKGIREDFIAIFGIFATLFIFLSIEIQILKQATRFSFLVGFSLFLLGAMLMFIMCLNNIVKGRTGWKDFWNPITVFIVSCLLGAVTCFLWATIIRPH